MNTTALKSIKKLNVNILAALAVTIVVATTSTLLAQCCNGTSTTASSLVTSAPVIISGPVTHSANYPAVSAAMAPQTYRIEKETQYREEEETSYQHVWDTEVRERKYSVIKQVPETTVQQEIYKVLRPVWTTEYRDTSYNVIRTVPETSEREERYTVSRPVWETAEREVWQTVQRPVQETVLQQRQYTVNRPVTTLRTDVVDQGQYVNYNAVQPGKTYNRLAWQQGGSFVDPATGTVRRQVPGLYWTPMQSEPKLKQQTVYQSNYVTQTTPVTTLMPETVVEQVPVTRTTYQEERIARKEPYQVMKMVQEEVVKKVPVTTYRQVVDRVQQTTPYQVYRMETQEVTRDIPVTRNKTVTEEKIEQYTVQVPRIQPIIRKVLKPYVVEKRIPLDEYGQPMLLPESLAPAVTSPTATIESSVNANRTIETPNTQQLPAVGGTDKTYGGQSTGTGMGTGTGASTGNTDPANVPPSLPKDQSPSEGVNLAK